MMTRSDVYRSVDELPLNLTVEDLMPILGIGRSAAYELARSERIKTIRVGRKIRIAKHELLQFMGIDSEPA